MADDAGKVLTENEQRGGRQASAPAPSSELPAASSLLSSRWSRDNLITPDPSLLYDGKVLAKVGVESLETLIQDLATKRPTFNVKGGALGVLTWDVSCESEAGPFLLQVPLALDEPGKRQRSKKEIPQRCFANLNYFIGRGLTRYLPRPLELITLGGQVPAALFSALPDHHPITFGGGALQIDLAQDETTHIVTLSPAATAELLVEMVAALVYHYEPLEEGGTALTDVFVNDGDFVVRRNQDGGFDLRLLVARNRETGINPNLLLLYLIQLMTYQDFRVDDDLIGIPTLMSNPSIAFAGVSRGLKARYQDLNRPAQEAKREAETWIRTFAKSREGRTYRPWVEHYLAGQLPPVFGEDLRERWWRLVPLIEKQSMHALRARQNPSGEDDSRSRSLKVLIDGLSREIGKRPPESTKALLINELGRKELIRLLEEVQTPSHLVGNVADKLLAHWPYRNLEQLLKEVPDALDLKRLRNRLSFGRIISEEEEGSLEGLSLSGAQRHLPGSLSNPEAFGRIRLPSTLHEAALRSFPTFESYMDGALHNEKWGYYARDVQIGQGGHFSTHPEALSPHYGKWLARWAFSAWMEMVARGELSEAEPFDVVEFGAGNGRLARDFLDSLKQEDWKVFGSRVRYRIYERSESLRNKQAQLLGDEASINSGDARQPEECLKRDFPDGLKGFVITNEVPDAFGVHKALFSHNGLAQFALVVPRVGPDILAALDEALSHQVIQIDKSLRNRFSFAAHQEELYLDESSYSAVMLALATLPREERESLLCQLSFEEIYLPSSLDSRLSAHLRANAHQYATALAAEDSDVILYPNVHADGFMEGIARSLKAGFVITIDYGESTWDLIQGARRGDFPFRIYLDGEDYLPRPNDPYSLPGSQDLTADVNFTSLARAGEQEGLCLVHFGRERDVASIELPEVLAATEQKAFAEFVGNSVFKVLVLGTRTSDLFKSPLMSPLPLIHKEKSLPKTRRRLIPLLQKALRADPKKDLLPIVQADCESPTAT